WSWPRRAGRCKLPYLQTLNRVQEYLAQRPVQTLRTAGQNAKQGLRGLLSAPRKRRTTESARAELSNSLDLKPNTQLKPYWITSSPADRGLPRPSRAIRRVPFCTKTTSKAHQSHTEQANSPRRVAGGRSGVVAAVVRYRQTKPIRTRRLNPLADSLVST